MGLRAALALLLAALVAAAAVGLWVAGYRSGKAEVTAQWAEAAVKSAAQVQQQVDRQRAVEDDERKRNAQTVAAINARLAGALERLRDRPDRRELPAAPAPACKGATGSDLSGPDAGFLVRESARADRLRAALSECYAVIDGRPEVQPASQP